MAAKKKTETLEVVTAEQVRAADLSQIATQIESTLDTIESHEGAFLESTLEHRLIIGLHVSKAIEAFSITNSEAGQLGGRGNKSESRRDSLSETADSDEESGENKEPASFVQWLCKASSRLQKPTAYKYSKAFLGLGLDSKATPEQVKMTLDTLRYSNAQAKLPPPNLGSLIKAAPRLPKPKKEQVAKPKDTKTIRLGDAREAVNGIVEAWDKVVTTGQLDDLEKEDLEALKEFLMTARDRVTKRLKTF